MRRRAEHEAPHVAARAVARPSAKRSASGMTTWFEIIVDSAIEATITIEVADEKPPRKASSAIASCRAPHRQRQHEQVGVRSRPASRRSPAMRDRQHEQA